MSRNSHTDELPSAKLIPDGPRPQRVLVGAQHSLPALPLTHTQALPRPSRITEQRAPRGSAFEENQIKLGPAQARQGLFLLKTKKETEFLPESAPPSPWPSPRNPVLAAGARASALSVPGDLGQRLRQALPPSGSRRGGGRGGAQSLQSSRCSMRLGDLEATSIFIANYKTYTTITS